MEGKTRVIAMIPARIGSTRLPMKNLALIAGEPMIGHAIRAAQESGVFDRIVVNSDAPLFAEIAGRYGVEFYLRPAELGSSATKSDDVVGDFMEKHPAETVCWVNPTSPLQTGAEIKAVVDHFGREGLDTLITVAEAQVHANFRGRPLNYRTGELFAQTQDLDPVELFVYSVMMWRSAPFLAEYREKGRAFFVGRVGFFPVSKLSAIIIKRQEDLELADFILRARRSGESGGLRYDPLAEEAKHG
ncbi:MAG: acylneuraminate cytidylyltransferase family protein [Thermodesulfobacteriota bacterium]